MASPLIAATWSGVSPLPFCLLTFRSRGVRGFLAEEEELPPGVVDELATLVEEEARGEPGPPGEDTL